MLGRTAAIHLLVPILCTPAPMPRSLASAPALHAPVVGRTGHAVRPTHVQVDLGRLEANLRTLQTHVGPGVACMPILKANAYGHGLVPVACHLERAGAEAIGVAYLEEGVLLRQAGVRCPVLVLGGIVDEQIPAYLEHDLSLTAPSVAKLRAIDRNAAAMGMRARVHLKIDTGMFRIGVRWSSAQPLLQAASECRHIELEGIYTHFANSDAADLGHARMQLKRFEQVLREAALLGLSPRWRHTANSAAVFTLPEAHFDLVRPGISLFGVAPSPEVPLIEGLRPALRWISRVVYFKVLEAGSPVLYGSTWAPTRRTRLVTVPVGYGDGYFRSLSSRSHVVLRGRRHPVVGRVCMDQLLVDIGWDSAWNGDQVVLLGEGQGQSVTAEELAELAGTIPYEVLTNINTRVPRVYTGG